MAKTKVSTINTFAVEWWDVERPVDYPLNARKWKPAAVAKVADSIQRYGWRQPIVVDGSGIIVIGHLRRAAARQAGLTPIPVHIAADLSPESVRGLRLADNRTHDEAEWDMDLLAREFGELKALDYDLKSTAFNLREIDALTLKPNPAEDGIR
jgi:ParB-like chromosome segregation protein Spo0J